MTHYKLLRRYSGWDKDDIITDKDIPTHPEKDYKQRWLDQKLIKPVTNTPKTVVKPEPKLKGDVNNDGKVDLKDVVEVIKGLGTKLKNGKYECKFDDCEYVGKSKHGLKIHHSSVHKK